MRRHTITAAILMVLAPLMAATPRVARAAGARSDTVYAEEALPSIADEGQGMDPVYTPGNQFGGQYGPGPCGPVADGDACGCGCQSCEPQPYCETCCCQCCCGPTFEVRAAGVMLKRNDPGDVPFLINAAGASVFNFSQFDFDFEPGVDASVIGYINPRFAVEARYLGIFDIDDRVFAALPATAIFINTTPPSPLGVPFPGSSLDAEYWSELHGGEINLRGRVCPCLTLLGGFRYVNLRERFDATFTFLPAPTVTEVWATRVQNELYGLQLGAEVNLVGGRGHCYGVEGFVKSGIFAVHAEQDSSLAIVAGPVGTGLLGQGSASDTQAAFVSEAGAKASFQVTRYLSVSAGYQILWLEGVAVASDQISATGVAPPVAGTTITPTGINVDGHVLYHGAKVGFDFRY